MWIPEADVVDHIGGSIASDDDFFVPPPPEIGEVITACTTLKQSAQPSAVTPRRILITVITGLVLFVLIALIYQADWKPDQIQMLRLIATVILGMALLIAWLVSKPKYTCSYVGARGIARFSCYGSRSRITFSQIFRFETAAYLKVSIRNIYVNGAYVNTEYIFKWYDSSNNQLFKLAGTYRKSKKPDDLFFIALSSEARWTWYLLPDALSSIKKGFSSKHYANRGSYLEIGPEGIEFKGKRIPYDDLNVSVENGFIVFRHTGEKYTWYKLDRAPRMQYSILQNAMLAVCLINEMTGRGVDDLQASSKSRYHIANLGIPG